MFFLYVHYSLSCFCYNTRCVSLNNIKLCVQIHDMQLLEKVIEEVGNQIGTFVSSCPNNFKGIWREYMRVRVSIDISKPLKRRMKLGLMMSWALIKKYVRIQKRRALKEWSKM